MGNSGEERFLPQLEAWSRGEDEVLAESAQWALKRIVDRAGEKRTVGRGDVGCGGGALLASRRIE